MATIIKIDDKLQARVTATKENENVVITVGPAAQSVPPGCRPIEVACCPLRTTAPSWVELVKWIEGFFLQPELVTIQHNEDAWTIDHVKEPALEWDNAPKQITVSCFTRRTDWTKISDDTWSGIYDQIRDRWPYPPARVKMTYDGAPITTEELQSKVKQERLRDPKPSATPEEVTEFTLCGDFRYRRQFGAWEEMSEWAHDHEEGGIEGITYGGEPIALEEIDRRANRQDTTGEIHVRLISDTGNVVDRAFPSWTSLIEWMDQHYRSPHTVHIMHDGERLSFDRVLARAQKERPAPPRGLANRLRAWWSK